MQGGFLETSDTCNSRCLTSLKERQRFLKNNFLNALRRSLENKNGIPFIIFLNDEQSNPPAGGYVVHFKN